MSESRNVYVVLHERSHGHDTTVEGVFATMEDAVAFRQQARSKALEEDDRMDEKCEWWHVQTWEVGATSGEPVHDEDRP